MSDDEASPDFQSQNGSGEVSTSLLQENKDTFRRFYDEVLNGRNISVMDELNAPNLVDHNRMNPSPTLSDLEAAKQSIQLLHRSFPDIKWRVDDMIAEGGQGRGTLDCSRNPQGRFHGNPTDGGARSRSRALRSYVSLAVRSLSTGSSSMRSHSFNSSERCGPQADFPAASC